MNEKRRPRTRPTRPRALGFETLEAVTLLSGMGARLPIIPAVIAPEPLIPLATTTPVVFNGTARGFYTSSAGVPDVGTSSNVFASGRLLGLGGSTVNGSLHSTGFIAQGHATGTLTIHAPRGNLTLSLTGPTQPGFSPLPGQFAFKIQGGTGRYAHASGGGTVDVKLSPISSAGMNGVGLITLTFHSNVPTPTGMTGVTSPIPFGQVPGAVG
jgi:hypothetical protein